MVINKRWFIT